MSVDELQQPLPPAGRNAAPLYRELTDLLKANPAVGDDKIATDGVGRRPLTADQAAKLRKALAHRSDIGGLIHRAVAMPDCVFTRPWRQGAAMTFPEFATMRNAARWLSAESALQLYDGDPLAAVRTEALLYHLADQTARDPMLIAYLVSVAIDAIADAGMDRVLYVAGLRPGVAAAVRRAAETAPHPNSLAFALRGEVGLPLTEMERWRSTTPAAYESANKNLPAVEGADALPPLSDDDRRHWGGFVDRAQAIYLSYLARLVEAADLPYVESQAVFTRVSREAEGRKSDAAAATSAIVIPVYSQANARRAQDQAKRGILEAAAAVLDYRVKHGAFPAKLTAAMAKPPVDPFDGKQLRYRTEGAGFLVWSAGPTGRFDGGAATTKPDAKETVLRYPMPAYVK